LGIWLRKVGLAVRLRVLPARDRPLAAVGRKQFTGLFAFGFPPIGFESFRSKKRTDTQEVSSIKQVLSAEKAKGVRAILSAFLAEK